MHLHPLAVEVINGAREMLNVLSYTVDYVAALPESNAVTKETQIKEVQNVSRYTMWSLRQLINLG